MSVGGAVALLAVAGFPATLGFLIARWWFVAAVAAAWIVYVVAVSWGTEPHEQGEFEIPFLIGVGAIATVFSALGVGVRRAVRLASRVR